MKAIISSGVMAFLFQRETIDRLRQIFGKFILIAGAF